MRIVIDNIELARGDLFCESPINLKIRSHKELQIAPLLRAKEARVFDRGNLRTRITFEVIRKHANKEESEAFVLQHAAMLAAVQGDAFFFLEDQEKRSFTLSDATVKEIESQFEGVTSLHTYEIVGSKFEEQ